MFNVFNGSYSENSGRPFIIGRVNRVVLGSHKTNDIEDQDYTCEKDLGAIYYEPLFVDKSEVNQSRDFSKPAYPIFGNIRNYPNIGEIVLIFSGPSSGMNDGSKIQDYFYLPPFAVWGDAHHNVFPRLEVYAAQIQNTRDSIDNNSSNNTIDNVPVSQGFTFEEQSNIKQLRPFEGDIIFQGRFGQSIRFGSSVPLLSKYNNWSDSIENGKPITIITNKQRTPSSAEKDSSTFIEDINKDGSSIYLTEGHVLPIPDLNLFPRRSYSSAKSNNPQVVDVRLPERYFKTNEFIAPNSQDNNSLNPGTSNKNQQTINVPSSDL